MTMTADTPARIRPATQRRPFRYRTQVMLLVIFAGYIVLSGMILKSAGNPPVRFRIDISHLVDASLMVKLHLAGALTAFVIGAILLRGVKGTGLHRKLGYAWVAAMALVLSALALAGGAAFQPDFREAAMIQATVDTILRSARERRWVAVDEVLPKGFVAG